MQSYERKFVSIANGKVVVVDNSREVCEFLEKVESTCLHTYVLETGLDYRQIEYIWEIRGCPARHGR